MIIKTILKFFIGSIHILSILFLISILMNSAYAIKSNEASTSDQNNKTTTISNDTKENTILIKRRTSSFGKIKELITNGTLKKRKDKKQKLEKHTSFKSYINYSEEQTLSKALDTEEDNNTDNFSSDSYTASYEQTPDNIEGDNIYFNRFMGKIIQATSNNQPYLIEVQKESPNADNYMDMNCFFINKIADLIPKTPYNFFYKGYYAPQTIVLGSIKSDPDGENNKIISNDENCIYENITNTTRKKLINYMMLRIGKPFKNIHKNIEIEPHYYYIMGMYLSICILQKIQLTIIYPEKNVSHNIFEVNNLNLNLVSQYLKNILIPIEFINKMNINEYSNLEKTLFFIIESERQVFDNFDTIVLELGDPSLYGLKVINIQMDYNFIEAVNKLKFSLYSFESKQPENIQNRNIIYEYNGYYILSVSILFANQASTRRYFKINDFTESTSKIFDLITDHIKNTICDTFKESIDDTNSFVILLSLLVCYNQKDSRTNNSRNTTEKNLKLELSTEISNLHDINNYKVFIQDSKTLQFGEFTEDTYNIQLEDPNENTDSFQPEDPNENTDTILFEKSPNDYNSDNIYENLSNYYNPDNIYEKLSSSYIPDNIYEKLSSSYIPDKIYEELSSCYKSDHIYDKLPNRSNHNEIYENSDIYLVKRNSQDITEIPDINDIIEDIDLIAIGIPNLLIINIINP
jgi:hypothetical protein